MVRNSPISFFSPVAGSLSIDASVPFTFETSDAGSFAVEIIGKDFVEGQSQDVSSVVEETVESVETTGPLSNSDVVSNNETENSSSQSFFETTAGIIVLIAVPSILILIIIALVVALMKKKPAVNPPVNTPPVNNNGIDPNQQPQV